MNINLPRIFSNRQFKWAAVFSAVLALTLVAFNLFTIGGDQFILNFNSGAGLLFSIINAATAVSVWQSMSAEKQNRLLWSGMLIGWILWALAEAVWTTYTILGQEPPYPSIADVFWTAGYIPMMIGLSIRAQTMPTKPNPLQKNIILVITTITILITAFFIFIPIIQNFNSQKILESIPNFIYPLADLIMVTIVWRLFFTYEEGDYGIGWKLLILGFLFVTISDFIFTYATLRGVYYPGMKANFISRFGVDVPYAISYLLWFTGIYALHTLRTEQRPAEQPISKVRIVRTYGHILVYTKSDHTVLEVSSNFGRLFENTDVIGKSFADALIISEQNANSILEKLKKEGKIADMPIQVRNLSGAAQETRISGVAITNPQKGYLGANLLLRTRVIDPAFDNSLDQPSKAMAKYLLEQSGSSNKAEVAQFLSDYYLSFIKDLFNMSAREGGSAASQAFLGKLQETAQSHNWQIQINPQNILDYTEYPLETLREALPALLETAKRFTSDLIDAVAVETRIKEVGSRFNDTVRRDIARYEKPGSEVGFADHRKKEMENTRPR